MVAEGKSGFPWGREGLGAGCKVAEGSWPISGVMQVALHVDCGLMFPVVTTH